MSLRVFGRFPSPKHIHVDAWVDQQQQPSIDSAAVILDSTPSYQDGREMLVIYGANLHLHMLARCKFVLSATYPGKNKAETKDRKGIGNFYGTELSVNQMMRSLAFLLGGLNVSKPECKGLHYVHLAI